VLSSRLMTGQSFTFAFLGGFHSMVGRLTAGTTLFGPGARLTPPGSIGPWQVMPGTIIIVGNLWFETALRWVVSTD
jgi:hypothetical protein